MSAWVACGQPSAAQMQQMTILLHKPVGYVSGQPEPGWILVAAIERAIKIA